MCVRCRSPSQLDADITLEMDAITMKALAKSPDDRYQSAKAMRDDCWRLLNDQPVTAHLPAVVPVDDATPASSAGPTRALPVQEEPTKQRPKTPSTPKRRSHRTSAESLRRP